jgi:hypothetical protein
MSDEEHPTQPEPDPPGEQDGSEPGLEPEADDLPQDDHDDDGNAQPQRPHDEPPEDQQHSVDEQGLGADQKPSGDPEQESTIADGEKQSADDQPEHGADQKPSGEQFSDSLKSTDSDSAGLDEREPPFVPDRDSLASSLLSTVLGRLVQVTSSESDPSADCPQQLTHYGVLLSSLVVSDALKDEYRQIKSEHRCAKARRQRLARSLESLREQQLVIALRRRDDNAPEDADTDALEVEIADLRAAATRIEAECAELLEENAGLRSLPALNKPQIPTSRTAMIARADAERAAWNDLRRAENRAAALAREMDADVRRARNQASWVRTDVEGLEVNIRNIEERIALVIAAKFTRNPDDILPSEPSTARIVRPSIPGTGEKTERLVASARPVAQPDKRPSGSPRFRNANRRRAARYGQSATDSDAGHPEGEFAKQDAGETEDVDAARQDAEGAKDADAEERKEVNADEARETDTEDAQEADAEEGKGADAEELKEADTEEGKGADAEETKEADAEDAQEADAEDTKEADAEDAQEADAEETKEADAGEANEADAEKAEEADTDAAGQEANDVRNADTEEPTGADPELAAPEAQEADAGQDAGCEVSPGNGAADSTGHNGEAGSANSAADVEEEAEVQEVDVDAGNRGEADDDSGPPGSGERPPEGVDDGGEQGDKPPAEGANVGEDAVDSGEQDAGGATPPRDAEEITEPDADANGTNVGTEQAVAVVEDDAEVGGGLAVGSYEIRAPNSGDPRTASPRGRRAEDAG